jgi:murein DD-endopeptidase MepM/ murein hydrolase activator NlpD
MKTIILFLNCFMLFAQKGIPAEKKIIQYICLSKNVDEIRKIEIFKNEFPNVFLFYPDINPINPTNKTGISSSFSSKRLHPIEGKLKSHNGIDIVAKKNTPVYAAADGIVFKSTFFNGKAGHSVEINHKYGFTTKYFHLSIFIVKSKELVKKGQIIGFLGTSGASTGAHLHYEILKNGIHINPISFLDTVIIK